MNTKSFLKTLLSGCAVAAICMPATAQDFDDDVIIVKANKRSQSLQDVTSAVSVLGKDELELTGFGSIEDLTALAPNLTISEGTTSPTSAVVAIRGILAGSDEQLTLDPAVATYIDGVYIGRTAASVVPMYDLEAIEVLRGPQGTLSGRNSTGGAISFRLRRPTSERGVDAEIGYGNDDHREALVRVNAGELGNDNLRASITYAHRQNDGYVDNLLTEGDDTDPGYINSDSVRAALEMNVGDDTTIYYSFDYSDIEGTPAASQFVIATPAVTGFLAGATTTPGCSLDFSFGRKDEICLNDSEPTSNVVKGHTLQIEKDFGNVLLRSTTAYRDWENITANNDFDGLGLITGNPNGSLFTSASLFNGLDANAIAPFLPNPAFAPFVANLPVPVYEGGLYAAQGTRTQNQFSQEIELVSDTTGPFNWVVGAYYFDEESTESNPQQLGFVQDVDQILRFNPGFAPNNAALADSLPAGSRFRAVAAEVGVEYATTAKAYAVYGQGEYRFGEDEKTGLTVGLRYSEDKKTIDQTVAFVNNNSATFSEPTGHVTLDHRFTDEINGYAKVSRGYRSGGFAIRGGQTEPFEPEILWSYEAGLKTQFLDNRARVNLAAFYSKYTDQQVNQPISQGNSFGSQIVNAGETEYMGFEADINYEPIDNLIFTGSVGYVDRQINQFPLTQADGTVINFADQVLARTNTPDLTASAAVQYTHDFDNGSFLTTRVGTTYEGKHFFFTVPLTSTFTRDLESDAYALVDAQIRLGGISVGDNEAFIQLWGKNILDKEYETRAIDFGAVGFGTFIYGRPASYGIKTGISF